MQQKMVANKHRWAIMVAMMTVMIRCGSVAEAQRIHGYVTSGLMVSQIEGDELKGFKHMGFVGGVGALVSLDDRGRWGLSVETLFAQRGSYNNSGDPYSIDLTLTYADIPLLIHYQDPYGGMLFGVGVDYGRMVRQPHNVMKYNPESFIPDTTDFSFLKNDLMAVVDARFTVWRGLQVDIRYQLSLIAVKRDWLFREYVQGRWTERTRDCYNQAISVRLIYQF